MNLIIFTQDFPFGTGESFLESEILVAQEYFDCIYVISTSQSRKLTRKLSDNIIPIKLHRYEFFFQAIFYAVVKLFSKEFFQEIQVSKKYRNRYSIFTIIRSCLITWLLKKRIQLGLKKISIEWEKTVLYSYWLSEAAYFVAHCKNDVLYRISRVHGFEIRDKERYIPFRLTLEKKLDAIFGISDHTIIKYNEIMQNVRTENKKCKISLSRLGVNPREKTSYVPLDKTIINLVSCSTIYQLKRLDIVIYLLANVNNDISINWIHIGWGKLGDHIHQLAETFLHSKPNVSYSFMGQVSNTKILDFYRNNYVDLFVNMSDDEGVPVSIMEAMTNGIPCFARNVGGISEIVLDNQTGYLVDKDLTLSEVSEQFNKVLNKLVNEDNSKQREFCRNFIYDNYNMSKNYHLFYRNLTLKIKK